MPFEGGDGGQSRTAVGEFVVAIRDLRYVMNRLHTLGVDEKTMLAEQSASLDLALVKIDRVDKAAQVIKQNMPDLGQEPGESPTDTVIRAVKKAENDGSRWQPVIGKNFEVTLHASPDIGFGGQGYPSPIDDANDVHKAKLPPRQFDESFDRKRVHVGVVDTGIFSHPDLAGRWNLEGGSVIDATRQSHSAGHATFIAGLILRQAPNCQLDVYGVLDRAAGTASVWNVARAIAMLANSCEILNLSLTCFTGTDEPPFALRRAVERLAPNIVVVAAAGNHGAKKADDVTQRIANAPTRKSLSWPAAFDRVVAVTAHLDGDVPEWSFTGPWVRLVAPGVEVRSSYLIGDVDIRRRPGDVDEPAQKKFESGYAKWSGTSFAAANVSGAIARLMETRRVTAGEALDMLQQRAPKHQSQIWGLPPAA